MQRIRTVGLCVVVATVLGGLGASNAAALPEVGRCVAEAGGQYTDGNCTVKGSSGSFEWVKNAVKQKFTIEGGELKYEGATGTEIKCTTVSGTGEYLEKGVESPTTTEIHNVVAKFKGCSLPLFGIECKTTGAAPGEVITTKLKGKLFYTSGKKTPAVRVNQALSPEVKKHGFAEFECPAIGIVVYVGEGPEKGHETILTNVSPLNTMSMTMVHNYYKGAKAGEQEPNFIEGKSTVIDNLEQSLSGPKGTFERADAVLETVITNEEELEIKA